MNKTMFLKFLKQWHISNSNNTGTHTAQYARRKLQSLEEMEADGDFIYENDIAVIGKYYYSITILPENSKDGKIKELHFCSYGFGRKCNITSNDYELESYIEYEYVVL